MTLRRDGYEPGLKLVSAVLVALIDGVGNDIRGF